MDFGMSWKIRNSLEPKYYLSKYSFISSLSSENTHHIFYQICTHTHTPIYADERGIDTKKFNISIFAFIRKTFSESSTERHLRPSL